MGRLFEACGSWIQSPRKPQVRLARRRGLSSLLEAISFWRGVSPGGEIGEGEKESEVGERSVWRE